VSAIPGWAYVVVCGLAPPLWGVVAAGIFRRRDRRLRSPPVDYSI
jgi:hypothetical protein